MNSEHNWKRERYEFHGLVRKLSRRMRTSKLPDQELAIVLNQLERIGKIYRDQFDASARQDAKLEEMSKQARRTPKLEPGVMYRLFDHYKATYRGINSDLLWTFLSGQGNGMKQSQAIQAVVDAVLGPPIHPTNEGPKGPPDGEPVRGPANPRPNGLLSDEIRSEPRSKDE